DLLIGPAFVMRPRRECLPEQRPLRAVGGPAVISEVRRQVPPLDAEIRVRTVVGRKREGLSGRDFCKARRIVAESGKALRQRAPAKGEQREPSRKCAPRDGSISAHWQR